MTPEPLATRLAEAETEKPTRTVYLAVTVEDTKVEALFSDPEVAYALGRRLQENLVVLVDRDRPDGSDAYGILTVLSVRAMDNVEAWA